MEGSSLGGSSFSLFIYGTYTILTRSKRMIWTLSAGRFPGRGKEHLCPSSWKGPLGSSSPASRRLKTQQCLSAVPFRSKWWASPAPPPDLSATTLYSRVLGEQGKLRNVRKTSQKGIISFSKPSREANCMPLSCICRSD